MRYSHAQHRHTTSMNHSRQGQRVPTDYSQSIVSEDRMKESVSTRRHTVTKSTDNLHLAKLESKVLEYQKRLDTQSYQIQTLTAETEHFMRMCEEQKEQINSLNLPMLRQEYQEHISQLVEEK